MNLLKATNDWKTPMAYDYKREILHDAYQEEHPVRNFLRYRQVAKAKNQDCDKLALADELAQVRNAGHLASAETLNSFFITYKAALKLNEYRFTGTGDAEVEHLIKLYDEGAHAQVNVLFARFAVLTHTRGNFMLVPVYKDAKTSRNVSLNQHRGMSGTIKDYWDRTLSGIKNGELSSFFGDNLVAQQFNIAAMPGGFAEYVEQNRLESYIGADGEVAPFWPGHLSPGTNPLPQTMAEVEAFLTSVCSAIEQREQELGQ
ncbi:hypothetical protein [Arthrobacter sp. efr-133-TYG-118]|uniref:DUF6994 family protein n=1 Tax=Arthrobacter sp. efr-133-TYG-118 TaxID=3040279 RepID=UPI00254CD983|nr:hypothetical protein [Arthrobacter sp. efr-133-TYG-118]